MKTTLQNFDSAQLLEACGVMESTLIHFIQKLDSQGIDTSDLRRGLNEAHQAVDGITS